jgi:hypothetical protein
MFRWLLISWAGSLATEWACTDIPRYRGRLLVCGRSTSAEPENTGSFEYLASASSSIWAAESAGSLA